MDGMLAEEVDKVRMKWRRLAYGLLREQAFEDVEGCASGAYP